MDIRRRPFKNKRLNRELKVMKLLRRLCVIGASLFFVSCASVSVRDVVRNSPPLPTRMPEKVFVAPFSFNAESIRVDRRGMDLVAFKEGLQMRMTKSLAPRLAKFVPAVEEVPSGKRLPRGNYWVVTGNFDRVSQGSRFLRAVVGLGAGGTKMETTVVVYDFSKSAPHAFLRIRTTGGSNITQGIAGVATFPISGPMALTNVFNALDGVRSGVTFDAVRTSREVSAAISEYLVQQGALPKEKASKPKRLGEPLNRLELTVPAAAN